MTKDEARIVLLEDALEGARSTIQFMHGCLTHPQYHYTYPDHTEMMVERINALVPERKYCAHSGLRNNEDCESCVQRVARHTLRHEAEQTLNDEGDTMDELRLSSLIEARNELEDAIAEAGDRESFFLEEELKDIDAEIRKITDG